VYPLVEPSNVRGGALAVRGHRRLGERGLRYESARGGVFRKIGTEIGGTIQFRSGDEVEIQGEVIRSQASVVVLSLKPPLGLRARSSPSSAILRSKGYSLKD